jgi:hypothetical protein
MTFQQSIRKKIWDDPDLGEFARGVATRFDTQPLRKLIEFSALYTEPMYLQLERNPVGILCIRIRQTNAPQASVLSGGMVDWVWESTRAKVTSIDGMSTYLTSGLLYTFTFEAVFAPAAGI